MSGTVRTAARAHEDGSSYSLIALAARRFPAAARAGDVTMVARDVPLGPRSLQAAAPPIRFNMLGLHWQGPGTVAYRTRSLAGSWSAWRLADADTGPDPSLGRVRIPAGTTATSTGRRRANGVQFRTRGPCHAAARLLPLVASRRGGRARATLSVAGSPSIVPRVSWEADEKIIAREAALRARPCKLAVVHHTAGTNRYTPAQAAAIVRGIEVYHVKGERLERHRLQLPRRPLRHRLRGPRRRDRRQRDRRARARVQHGHRRRGADRQLQRAAPPPPAMQSALVQPARLAARRRARRPALAPSITLGRQPEVQGREGRHAARHLGPPRHRADRVPRQPRLRAAAVDRDSASRRRACRSSTPPP